MRDYRRGEEGVVPDFAARVTGAGDVYDLRGRRPWASVNFITAHDGFTLDDLVSFDDKYNAANGENDRDGHSDNRSLNLGAEGPTDDPDIRTTRERQKRNFLATLFLGSGTPMLPADDEFGRSQSGNDNGYAQDNELSGVDWTIDDAGAMPTDVVREVIALRAPAALAPRFVSRRDRGGVAQSGRRRTDAGGMGRSGRDDDRTEAVTRRSRRRGRMERRIVLFNSHEGSVPFRLPERNERPWGVVLDTTRAAASVTSSNVDTCAGPAGDTSELPPRSLVVLV